MTNLAEIEKMAKEYRDALDTLSKRRQDYEDESVLVDKKHLRLLKYAGDTVEEKKAKLHAAIDASPELFEKPRTAVFHGIKVGFQKVRAGLEWEDDNLVSKLIEKYFPEQFEILVKVEKSPIKKALIQMEKADLRKVGIRVVEAGDEVTIKATVSDIEKWLSAFRRSRAKELKDAA